MGCLKCGKTITNRDDRSPDGAKITLFCPACREDLVALEPDPEESPPPSPPGDEIQGEELKRRILDSLDDLPPMPETMLKARELMTDPDSSIKDLADALEADQSITAKVLRIANSAFYGMSGKVASIQRAAVLLGQRNLAEVVTLTGAADLLGFELFGYGIGAGDLWRHSVAAAYSAKRLSEQHDPELADEAFIAGLMHDSGKIVLDSHILERKAAFEEFLDSGERMFIDAERRILGFDHSEIAAEMCARWNIPPSVGAAIRYHHQPSLSDGNMLSYILHVADHIAIVSGAGSGAGVDDILHNIDPGAMNFLELTQEILSDIVFDMMESMEKLEAMRVE